MLWVVVFITLEREGLRFLRQAWESCIQAAGSGKEGIGFMALDTKGNLGAWTGMWLPGG